MATTIAILLIILITIVHSWLGERYILMRLFRRDLLPELFGGTEFTKRTIRLAWHLTSVAWLGFALILWRLADDSVDSDSIARIIGGVFLIHALVAFFGSRAKHLSWIVFLAIAVLAIYVIPQ